MDLGKRILLLICLSWIFYISHSSLFAAHIRGGFITATLLENNTLSYRISLTAFVDAGSTIMFGGGSLDFGDGSEPINFEAGKPDFYKLLDEEVALNVFYADHSFPGPGTFTIGYREFNRNGGIDNMENSESTPFYVEAQILIDPYLGANSSVKILNYFPFKNKTNQPYFFPLNVIDPDGDSISIELSIPLQDKDVSVANYFVPANFDGNKILSQIQLHVPANEIIWANPLEEGEFNYAVKIREWRFNPSENTWINVGYTTLDFQMIILERTDQPPDVIGFGDTAILASVPFNSSFTIRDDNAERLRVCISENIPGADEFVTSIDQEIYYPAPVMGDISITPFDDLRRSNPYKIVIFVNPEEFNSTSTQKSSMLWISDKAGKPEAPNGLKTHFAFQNTIILGWQDLSDLEAGYTVERADSFFPEFIRIAALPENTTVFTDANVIPNRDYYYRVRAIGTEGSSYSDILEVREMDIITGISDQVAMEDFFVYPNPTDKFLIIPFNDRSHVPTYIKIIDMTGKMKSLFNPHYPLNTVNITIPIGDLLPGTYLLQLEYPDHSLGRKFIKN
ncbi:MAG: T9SS type A sorting domain-containing protein [Cyclobacteriaceae bacterium]|nr:T9SS type A sorting domain-containing protein [Cyclobacteriaceae bacterium]